MEPSHDYDAAPGEGSAEQDPHSSTWWLSVYEADVSVPGYDEFLEQQRLSAQLQDKPISDPNYKS